MSPISDDILALAIESWAMWLRWSAAFERKETTIETHPCLPEDRARHAEIEAILKTALVLNEETAFAATAQFRYNQGESSKSQSMQVQWTFIEFHPNMDHRTKYRWDESDNPNTPINPSRGADVS